LSGKFSGLFILANGIAFFYIADYNSSQKEIVLDEDTSRHVVQVLRMKEGEKLNLTDGKGSLITGEVIDAHKKTLFSKDHRLTTNSLQLTKSYYRDLLIKEHQPFRMVLRKSNRDRRFRNHPAYL
jgi:RsmE family RNA methyltransferase